MATLRDLTKNLFNRVSTKVNPIIQSLDRDKEKAGFQILSSKTNKAIDNYTRNKVTRDITRIQNTQQRRKDYFTPIPDKVRPRDVLREASNIVTGVPRGFIGQFQGANPQTARFAAQSKMTGNEPQFGPERYGPQYQPTSNSEKLGAAGWKLIEGFYTGQNTGINQAISQGINYAGNTQIGLPIKNFVINKVDDLVKFSQQNIDDIINNMKPVDMTFDEVRTVVSGNATPEQVNRYKRLIKYADDKGINIRELIKEKKLKPLETITDFISRQFKNLKAGKVVTNQADDVTKLLTSGANQADDIIPATVAPQAQNPILSQLQTVPQTPQSVITPPVNIADSLIQEASKYKSAEEFLYHGTNSDVLDNISKEGLKPGMSTGNISLSPNESYAKQWSQSGMTPQGKTEGVMLRVNRNLLKSEILPSKSGVKADQLNELISKDVIPPEAIEIKIGGKWQQLTDIYNQAKGTTIKAPQPGKVVSQTKNPILNQLKTKTETSSQKVVGQPLKSSKIVASNPIIADFDKNLTPDISKSKAGVAYLSDIDGQDVFKQNLSKFIADRDISNITATQRAGELAKIPTEIAQDVIDYREGVTTKATPEVKEWADKLNKKYDELYKEISTQAKKAGIEVGYLENYQPHYWKEPIEEVQQTFMAVKKGLSETKGRIIPTYQEGIELGFTPRFNHPAEMLEQYVRDMERFKAGIELMETLKQEGTLVPASVARTNPGFMPINAPGFGTNDTNIMGKTWIGKWYAPADQAQQINKLFAPDTETGIGNALDKTAKFSAGLQDITLSGGVPGTPINAFTVAQIQKEFLSLNFKSPMSAAWNSLSTKRTQEFFDTNAEQMKKMLSRNVPIRSGYSVGEMIDQKTAQRIFGDGIGNAWSKLVNEPTFKRFMPMLQINLFNRVEAGALKAGKSEAQAIDLASKVVKNFYGLTDTFKTASRSKIGNDIKSTFLFAPHFRESMINVWLKTAKSLSKPLAKENRMNVRFVIGAIATYLAMSALNKKLTGHSMADNPTGKKDKLLIPVGGGQTIGIPYLSSIATIPRMLASAGGMLVKGDISGAAMEGRKALSMAIKPLIDVMANKDYFERDIVDETDTPKEKLTKQGEYLLKSYAGHPYLRELIELYTKPDKPTYQRLSMAMELPLRFYDTDSVELAPFWEKYFELKAVNERYDSLKYKDEAKANDYLNENEDKINEFNLMKAYLKFNYDQEEAGEDPTAIKDYLALAESEPKYEISDDAPKNKLQEVILYGKSFLKHPIDTIKVIKSGEPVRKIRGDALVVERELGATDKDPNTQKDHRIPLWAGGLNNESNTYYLSNEDHKAKTAFETPLRKMLEEGVINKRQVEKAIDKWHEENNIQSIEPPITTPKIASDSYSSSTEITEELPTDQAKLEKLYASARKVIDDYEDKKDDIIYSARDEASRTNSLANLDKNYQYAKDLIDKIATEQPEQIKEIELNAGIEAYKSGGGATVEVRANWIKLQLEGLTGKERQDLINRFWDEKVLTSTAKGTAAKLREMGVSVSGYTGTTAGKTSGGVSSKKITAKSSKAGKISLKQYKPATLRIPKAPTLKAYKPKTIALATPQAKKYKFSVIKPTKVTGGKINRIKAKR